MKNKNIQKINFFRGWVYIALGYVLIIAIIFLWCFSFNTSELRGQLISILPWFLEINFICIVVGIALNIKVFKACFEKVSPRSWGVVAAIVLLGCIMAFFAAPKTHGFFMMKIFI